jgi:hypothetical protein
MFQTKVVEKKHNFMFNALFKLCRLQDNVEKRGTARLDTYNIQYGARALNAG